MAGGFEPGEAAGYALLFNPGVGRFYIDAFVHPAQRGRGIGTHLMRLAEACARQRLAGLPAGELHVDHQADDQHDQYADQNAKSFENAS
jgi:GNAT superfamily N-acetyltransferase